MKEEVEWYGRDNKDIALEKSSEILKREVYFASFNGIIGSKNEMYAIDQLDYDNPEEYIKNWNLKQDECYAAEKDIPYEKASNRVHELLEDELLQEYTIINIKNSIGVYNFIKSIL